MSRGRISIAWPLIAGLVGCFAFGSVLSCGDATTPSDPFPPGPVQPGPNDDLTPDPPSLIPDRPSTREPSVDFRGSTELLLEAPVDRAAPLLQNGVLAVSTEAVLRVVEPGTAEAEWPVAVGDPVVVAALDAERALIAGTDGLFALDGEHVTDSPLDDLLDGQRVVSLVVVGEGNGQRIWIATDQGLFRWQRRNLVAIVPGDLPVAGAHLAWGAPVNDRPALWVAAEGQLYALVSQGGGLVAYRERDDLVIDDLGTDRLGQLWVAAGGDVHGRAPDGLWTWFDIGADVISVAAHAESRDVWFASDTTVWHFRRGEASGDDIQEAIDSRIPRFTLAAELTSISGLAADATGRLVVAGPGGLQRISLGRPLVVGGLKAGDQLVEEPAAVRIFPAREDLLDELVADLDGEMSTIAGPPFGLVVDPATLETGIHTLSVEARYRDDFEPVVRELLFTVGEVWTPGWAEDVEPLYQERCSECHDSRGTAHQMDTARAWEAEIEEILEAARVGRMPLAPNPELPLDEVELIEGWLAGGFRP